MERDFKGIWIPKEVWLDERLTALDKIILMEINSLDNEEGCFASNEYLAEFCQCSEAKVSKAIAKLKELGYIYTKKFDGRVRFLGSCLVKSTRQTSKKYEADSQKVRHNNITNNIANNVERKKEEAFDDVFVRKKVSPELKDAFVELIKSRKLNNKKMTNRALELAIDKVRQLEDDEYYQIEIVNQSVANGWQGLFPLKDKKAKEIPHDELSRIEDDGDVTWKRVFDFWRQTLGYEDFITNQSVHAAKKLLEMDGEEGVKKLIVALRMRSQHRYLSSEIRNVSSLVDLLDHRQAIWGFYNLHAEDWGRQMKQSLQGKKRWQL